MIRAITSIEIQNPDLSHQIGQTLLSPLSTLFGKSYRVENRVHELPDDSLLKRVTVAALAVILFPLTFIAGLVGSCFLQFSTTHKEAYDEIEGAKVSIIWNENRPEIRTKQLLIRPIQGEDLPTYQALFSDRVAMQLYAGGPRDITDRFGIWLNRWQEHSFSALAVVDPNQNRVIGHTIVGHGDYEGDREHGFSEMAVVIDPAYWNADFSEGVQGTQGKKGIGTEVVRAAVAYAKALRERGQLVPCDFTADQEVPAALDPIRGPMGNFVYLPFTELRASTSRANVAGHKILEKIFVHENGGGMRPQNGERDLFTINLAG